MNRDTRDILEQFAYEDLKQSMIKENCKQCGTKENLTIHHKKKVSKYPHLQYVKSNCVILCEKCHKKIHSKRNNNH